LYIPLVLWDAAYNEAFMLPVAVRGSMMLCSSYVWAEYFVVPTGKHAMLSSKCLYILWSTHKFWKLIFIKTIFLLHFPLVTMRQAKKTFYETKEIFVGNNILD
jgi:hypothetical protein